MSWYHWFTEIGGYFQKFASGTTVMAVLLCDEETNHSRTICFTTGILPGTDATRADTWCDSQWKRVTNHYRAEKRMFPKWVLVLMMSVLRVIFCSPRSSTRKKSVLVHRNRFSSKKRSSAHTLRSFGFQVLDLCVKEAIIALL